MEKSLEECHESLVLFLWGSWPCYHYEDDMGQGDVDSKPRQSVDPMKGSNLSTNGTDSASIDVQKLIVEIAQQDLR